MPEFLACVHAAQDHVLHLNTCDDETAHAALRQMHHMDLLGHDVHVVLSPAQRKHKAFTPWLRDCVTTTRVTPSGHSAAMVLRYASTQRHVHSTDQLAPHAASFDLRVGGKQCRVLVDTGATVSCMSEAYAHSLGQPLRPIDTHIEGIGGKVACVGSCEASVKVGKHHAKQKFTVV
jgi:hypothetical protein